MIIVVPRPFKVVINNVILTLADQRQAWLWLEFGSVGQKTGLAMVKLLVQHVQHVLS